MSPFFLHTSLFGCTKSTFCSLASFLLVHVGAPSLAEFWSLYNFTARSVRFGACSSFETCLMAITRCLRYIFDTLRNQEKRWRTIRLCTVRGRQWKTHICWSYRNVMWLWRMTQRSALKALCASFRAKSGTAWIAVAAQGQSMRPLMQRMFFHGIPAVDQLLWMIALYRHLMVTMTTSN